MMTQNGRRAVKVLTGSVPSFIRQIQLVLTDVLKTEQGLAYLDKKRRGLMTGNGERKRESWVGSGQRRVSQSSREGGEDRRDDPQYRKRPHDHDTPTSTRKETR